MKLCSQTNEGMMGIHTSFIGTSVYFDEAFEHGAGAKFWGYVGTIPESLYVEFCNFVEYHTFVNYLSCCY
jgi:hypothetical protein